MDRGDTRLPSERCEQRGGDETKAGDDHRAFLFTSPEAARKMIAAAASGRPLNVSAARTISMNAAPRPRIYFLKIGSNAWIVAAVMPGFLSSAS